eukprot:TRINITY_DN15475_c0_g1_i1.p1 TRINITY_DN15475_c0_g1~~TRINITY_DN15475_c0_g1_i1.p1  ORF type:complete len:542 (-),score=110.99 TRINITY_DN15475_c0_g1_i1:72-1697(-)
MKITFFLLVVCSFCLYVSSEYIQTPQEYASGGVNFEWNYLNYYGDQQPNTSSNVLTIPQDFVITQDGLSLVVIEFVTGLIKTFAKSSLGSFVTEALSITNTLSITELEDDTFIIGAFSPRLILNDNSTFYDSSSISRFSGVYGLYFDQQTDIIYGSDYHYSRVFALNASLSNSPPLRIYGKMYSNNTRLETNVSISNIGGPNHMRVDCFGNLWIVDSVFNRILRYPPGSTVPNLVWGQSSFTLKTAQKTANGMTSPLDIVFDKTCNIAFVSDSDRVLRFHAPFVSNQYANGVLGASNFTSPGAFGKINRIQIEDFGNHTALLYLLDYSYNRILVGMTQWNVTPEPLVCVSSPSSVCIVQQPVLIESSVLTLNYSLLVLSESLSVDNSSQIIIGSEQQIQSSGDISLGGNLTLLVGARSLLALQNNKTIEITLFTTNATVSGRFSTVRIENGETECKVESEAVYGERSMGVLLRQEAGCGGEVEKKLSKGEIAAIVIGAAVGVVIVVVLVGVLVGIVGWRMREKMKKKLSMVQFGVTRDTAV